MFELTLENLRKLNHERWAMVQRALEEDRKPQQEQEPA